VILQGDCREVLQTLDAESVDSCVTDPPYELGFMGKRWDATGVAFDPATWAAVLRVLKPGAHLLAFGGTRTHHRMVCAIEDAGFEIRDEIQWLYGSGFPKSLDVSKAIDARKDWSLVERLSGEIKRARAVVGWSLAELGERMKAHTDEQYGKWYHRGGHMFFETGRSLPSRPEWDLLRSLLPIGPEFHAVYEAAEREVVGAFRNDRGGRAISIIQGGIEYAPTAPATESARQWEGWGTALKPACEPICLARKPLTGTVAANVLAHGTGALNIDGCRVGSETIRSSGWTGMDARRFRHGTRPTDYTAEGKGSPAPSEHTGRWPANVILDPEAAALLDAQSGERPAGGHLLGGEYADIGYHGHATRRDAFAGYGDSGGASRFFYVAKPSGAERGEGNNHPTVKPLTLLRYLVRLVTPPGGLVLDPFAGSGTTLYAAQEEGFRFVGIELNAEYIRIAERRMAQGTLGLVG
jgi:hypothetical protein